jgi:hypothetical protein
MENYNDQLSRLNLMADDDGTTWDLSENDQAAISAVLDKLSSVEAERDAAQAEVERLQADAKRYRYIRSLGTEQPERFDATVDAAIDAARGEK